MIGGLNWKDLEGISGDKEGMKGLIHRATGSIYEIHEVLSVKYIKGGDIPQILMYGIKFTCSPKRPHLRITKEGNNPTQLIPLSSVTTRDVFVKEGDDLYNHIENLIKRNDRNDKINNLGI